MICFWICIHLHFAAKANSEDTMTYHKAMNSPDAEGFYNAMEAELEQLESLNPWDVVPRLEAEAIGANILPSKWAFKRKRYPSGTVCKLMAWLCTCSDRQLEGIDFFEMYAPLVAWSTVRLLLVLTEARTGNKTIGLYLAFVQSELQEVVYVEKCQKG